MEIAVYAICKNEAAFVRRWMDSMGEADHVVVLDTGSTDDSVARLRSLGARVTEETICPWRFDYARNRSLALVPETAEICVCTDLDEVFHPGWRAALERAWTPGAGQARYRYTWSFQPDGREGVVFYAEKIHARRGYRWVHPVHEVLAFSGTGAPGRTITVPGIQLDHHPDPGKSRAQYLPLLELAVQEAPEDDRNLHYLGREYYFRGRWQDCISTLRRHLALPSATWAAERCASMRYIGRSWEALGNRQEARRWYLRAVAEAPGLREPYLELAKFLYREKDWEGVVYFTACALEIQQREDIYITEADSWGSLPHDLQALGYYYTGRPRAALDAAAHALALEPDNARLRKNLRLIRAAC